MTWLWTSERRSLQDGPRSMGHPRVKWPLPHAVRWIATTDERRQHQVRSALSSVRGLLVCVLASVCRLEQRCQCAACHGSCPSAGWALVHWTRATSYAVEGCRAEVEFMCDAAGVQMPCRKQATINGACSKEGLCGEYHKLV